MATVYSGSRTVVEILHRSGGITHSLGLVRPIEVNMIHADDNLSMKLDIVVDEMPPWAPPPPLIMPKKIPDLDMLKKNLMQEPWLSMSAYADALEEAGDKLAYGWRNIVEWRRVPMSLPRGNFVWESGMTTDTDNAGVPYAVWNHDSISYLSQDTYTTGFVPPSRRHGRLILGMEAAWEALALAWTEVEGK